MVTSRMDSNIATKINASVSLTPPGSHVVILSLIAILGISLVATFAFVFYDANYWIPLIVSTVILIVIVVFWLRSHRDIDHASITPTTLSTTDGNNSTAISLHPRAKSSAEELAALERILSTMRNRSLLPDPDGLVDDKGQPVPNSQHDARERIASTNDRTRKEFESGFGHFREPDAGNRFEQSTLSDTPELGEIQEANFPNDRN